MFFFIVLVPGVLPFSISFCSKEELFCVLIGV